MFGFVAAEADVCVLLRVGPGKKTLMVRWNLATDEFEIGQWLVAWVVHGDLSDDGTLFAYKACKPTHAPQRWYFPSTFCYSVVCRPPFFTALAFWGDDREDRVLCWTESPPERPVSKPQKGALPHAYFARLTRIERLRPVESSRSTMFGDLTRYPERGYDGFYSLNDDLLDADWAENDDLLDADWADVDHRGRLLLARKGRIYVRDSEEERELIDLNPFEFRSLAPPAWATNWPVKRKSPDMRQD